MLSKLSIHALIQSDLLREDLQRSVNRDRYHLICYGVAKEFTTVICSPDRQPDCLLIQETDHTHRLFQQLVERGILLPIVILTTNLASPAPLVSVSSNASSGNAPADPALSTAEAEVPPAVDPVEEVAPAPFSFNYVYHSAEVWHNQADSSGINASVDKAIVQFLQLSPLARLGGFSASLPPAGRTNSRRFLVQHQQRLAEKLRERLGYLGVYYKRDTKQFLRHLPPQESQELWAGLRVLYRDIVLNYFENSSQLNTFIDEFVNLTFFADIPVTNVVELHMELMDEFSKQLKMEGRSEEVLLDYRLTLIDIIAHLCEMYRRSIPRED
ncbi:circadian clock protein KaiA [Prochlorothrix hollandica]|uniref:circadian clock protein KaiA n=1 Tax=Prochlorothrix hollandica TaxID=1223 RepID=UPI00034700A4|nr:circadian clock protein KaiA [Prochlorothrix hollandica]